MKNRWRRYLLRHGLFTYARTSLFFFVNLYIWSQRQDLQAVALFNIILLSAHTAMFFLALPFVKNGHSQSIMKVSIAGLAAVLLAASLLGEQLADYTNLIALAFGVTNGLYWFINHIEILDKSDTKSRASFMSYRIATQGAARLLVPAIGWLAFVAFADTQTAYNVIFAVGMIAMVLAWFFVDIPPRPEKKLNILGSLREFRQTKYFGIKMFNGFFYGFTLRSALPTVLLPFLIFQVVDGESELSSIQTAVEVLSIGVVYYFAGHKKNTEYITHLFYLGFASTLFGLLVLFVSLSIQTYIMFVISYIVALSATNIALGTMSGNYATTMNSYDDHRIEYIVVRELLAIAGFISGYIFLYFNPNLTLSSLRPLLVVMMFGLAISAYLSLKLWHHVQDKSRG